MSNTLQISFQILSLLCGLCVMILAIRALIYGGAWGYIIINIYVLFFGTALVVKELFSDKILHWFNFLKEWIGLGLYIIFIGMLALTSYAYDTFWFYMCIGVLVVGLLMCFIHCLAGGNPKNTPLCR
eukprot:TRINITY_DN9038_c0_g1_i1.p1 TRINITY_DN9038_c0_g1~~TRINITY_DN9038_c0_g1_i1.p1  ORF type:complete len:127 (-),score=22.79 TRINITY_DN9038_c0_g1_i1:249-629(-)